MQYFFRRTIAYLVDCAIVFSAVMLVIQWLILRPLHDRLGFTDAWFQDSWHMELYVLLSSSLPVWLYFTLLDSEGGKGTPGKRWMKLRLEDTQGNRIPVVLNLLRTIIKLAPWEIIHVGVIFPTPLYFEESADLRWPTYLGIGLFVAYVISLLVQPQRRTVYDWLLETVVRRV